MERAEFTTRLVEATIRLAALGGHAHVEQAWLSALSVARAPPLDVSREGLGARRFLIMGTDNPSSVRSCITIARDNARAARTALTREAWEAINRAWLMINGRTSPGNVQGTLSLVEELKAELRGFEGALARMLRNEGYWFMRLGSMIERGDATARLLDVKYYLLLPEGQEVGGALDRDQWQTILQIVSAKTAYRHLYREVLKPWLVADMLIFRRELPRSLAWTAEETVDLLGEFGGRSVGQDKEGQWQRRLVSYLKETGISYTYWSWNPNSGDTGGILQDDWQTANQSKLNVLSAYQWPATTRSGGG
jgi:uncharacterized alpha-E superfamily protein